MAAARLTGMGQLFWKFLLAFWLALGLAFGGVFTLNQLSQSPEQHRSFKSPQGRFFLDNAQRLLDAGGEALLLEMVRQWQNEPFAREQLLVLDSRGQDLLQRPVPPEALTARSNMVRLHSPQGALRLVLLERDGFWQQRIGAMRQRMTPPPSGRPEGGEPPPRPPFWFNPFFLLGAVVMTTIATSLWLAWYFAAPVRQLKQALSELPKQQWQTQLSPRMTERRDEFGVLARSFNQMAQQVYQAIVSQRRLLHDVSHELRSPLARLQLLTGLVRQNPADLAGALDKIEAEAVRLDQLVGEILTFSRLESGEVKPQLSAVPVHELLESICADAALEADNRQQQLRLLQNDEVTLQADAELLYRALENVVRNAIKYAGTGAQIQIVSQRGPGQLRIEICDNGPGVPEALLPLLFNPFFRADKQSEGVGLGLSIALRAVAACGGQIAAENLRQPDGVPATAQEPDRAGLKVVILLPL